MSDDLDRDEERLAEIIRLFPDEDEHDADVPADRPSSPTYCLHRRISLNKDAHRAYCREPDCGVEIDLFDWVWRMTGDWEHIVRWTREAKRRSREARTRLEEILRLERNARARLKRVDPAAARSAPAVPWGEGSPPS